MKRLLLKLTTLLFLSSAHAAEKLPVLIIDGQNNHAWRATTPMLQRMLEITGRFEVAVFSATDEAAWKTSPPDFTQYRAIILNFYGKAWPKEHTDAFNQAIADGCGLVVYHAALAGLAGNPEYDKMIAVGWRKAGAGKHCCFDDDGKLHVKTGTGASGHDALRIFPIDHRISEHPILGGELPSRWMHNTDELYYTMLGPAENMTILASGLSQTTRVHEPLLWTVAYEKSRVFCTALGHDQRGILCRGFQSTFTRGTEWAATGKVTIPDIESLPTADEIAVATPSDLLPPQEPIAPLGTVRINAGGETIKIGDVTYLADVPHQPGGYGYTSAGNIAASGATLEDATLQSCRYGNFAYRFDCPNGDYDITLSFAENWLNQPGQRVFSVLLNGEVVLADLDIAKEVGSGKPLKKTFRVTAKEGRIDLGFTNKVNNALINAIEIKSLSPASE